VHSGSASGIVPSSFRVMRTLLSRLEDEKTGKVLVKEFDVDIPAQRLQQVKATAGRARRPRVEGVPVGRRDEADGERQRRLILNRTWRPTLSLVGASGIPEPKDAGNVLRPKTT
jgi:hypothetical protein